MIVRIVGMAMTLAMVVTMTVPVIMPMVAMEAKNANHIHSQSQETHNQ